MRKVLKWIAISIGILLGVALGIGAVLALIGRSRLNGRYQVTATLAPDPAGMPAQDFTRALRTGVAPGGRQLSDWMPWKLYASSPTRSSGRSTST